MDSMSILYELKNIEYFFDEKRVLSIDNLILEENKIIGFFGPNGSGKSTLFSILSFISKPQNGEIIIDENIKKSVVMLPQNPYLLKRTVFENIAYGLKIRGESVDLKSKVEEAPSLVKKKSLAIFVLQTNRDKIMEIFFGDELIYQRSENYTMRNGLLDF
jgi:tungstate transport system ATP-binding protein